MFHLGRRAAYRLRLLLGGDPDRLALREHELETTLRNLRTRAQELETTLRNLRTKHEVEHAAMKRESASRHRRVLSPEIVRNLLPLRRATIPARAADPGAAAAEARLTAASPQYRGALAKIAQPPDGLVRTQVQGLTWWVPAPASLSAEARDRVVDKQRFPYRNVTQTREFALGPVMLDIGANMGRMSIARVILGDFVHAYCAEPDPLNYEALVRNVVDNGLRGLVLPDQAAIGSVTGTARLRHAKYSGGHRLVRGGSANETIEVPCWRLDDWCERLSIDPRLITYVKVDTQGWEVHVLHGAPRLLAHRHIAWQIEVCPSMLADAGTSAGELYDMCVPRFTHFIDLSKHAEGPRARPTADLWQALAYLESESHTDIILFNLE